MALASPPKKATPGTPEKEPVKKVDFAYDCKSKNFGKDHCQEIEARQCQPCS